MIFHERAEIRSTEYDQFGQLVTTVVASLPVEVVHTRSENVNVSTGPAIPVSYVTFYGREGVDLITSSTVLWWRDEDYAVDQIPEKHYVRGRFSHWEAIALSSS